MKILTTLIVSFIFFISTGLTVPIYAQSPTDVPTITIEGQLINGTTGEPGPAGIPLMLHTYQGRQMTGMIDGQTGPEGKFRFENIEPAEGQFFGVMATVGQTTYFSEITTPSPDKSILNLPVTFFDTTTDTSAIRVEQMHTLIDFFNPILLEISEIYIISNNGDKTVEGAFTLPNGQTASMAFDLPEGAQNLSFEQGQLGERFIQTDSGFADTYGIPPGRGTSQFVVQYYLPYEDGLELSRSLAYPTDNLSVILPRVGVTLATSDLVFRESRQLRDGRQVDIFGGSELEAGQTYTFRLEGEPELDVASASSETSPTAAAPTENLPVVLGSALIIAGLALAGGGVWWYRRQKLASTTETELPEQFLPEETRSKEELLEAIAALEEAYEAGTVDETEYTHRREALRAALKQRLLEETVMVEGVVVPSDTAAER